MDNQCSKRDLPTMLAINEVRTRRCIEARSIQERIYKLAIELKQMEFEVLSIENSNGRNMNMLVSLWGSLKCAIHTENKANLRQLNAINSKHRIDKLRTAPEMLYNFTDLSDSSKCTIQDGTDLKRTYAYYDLSDNSPGIPGPVMSITDCWYPGDDMVLTMTAPMPLTERALSSLDGTLDDLLDDSFPSELIDPPSIVL